MIYNLCMMRKTKKIMRLVVILALFLLACFGTIGCVNDDNNEEIKYVDYSVDNNYEVDRVEDDKLVTYLPKNITPKYGMIFYVGTAITPDKYDYLGKALARQGYVMTIPKESNCFAYLMYMDNEISFDRYPNIEFFVGGHSQGGGASVKRTQENIDRVKGTILYAPLCYKDDSIKDTNKPTLLIEATLDNVLTTTMKEDAKSRLPENRVEYMIEGCHMSFSSMDEDLTLSLFNDGPLNGSQKAFQKEETVRLTLAFMKSVILG